MYLELHLTSAVQHKAGVRNILPVHRDSRLNTVVPGFRVLGFRALPGFRALNPATEVGRYIKRYLDLEHLFPGS